MDIYWFARERVTSVRDFSNEISMCTCIGALFHGQVQAGTLLFAAQAGRFVLYNDLVRRRLNALVHDLANIDHVFLVHVLATSNDDHDRVTADQDEGQSFSARLVTKGDQVALFADINSPVAARTVRIGSALADGALVDVVVGMPGWIADQDDDSFDIDIPLAVSEGALALVFCLRQEFICDGVFNGCLFQIGDIAGLDIHVVRGAIDDLRRGRCAGQRKRTSAGDNKKNEHSQ